MTEVLAEVEGTPDFEQFQERLEEMDALPSLPGVVAELLDCLKDPSTEDSQIVQLISRDTGLTARLLKLANSAAMGLRVQVTSIQRAVPLLGRDRIRQICLGGGVWDSLRPMAEKANFALDAFERHSLAVADMAQALATRSQVAEADDVFASALLHDIGKFLLFGYDSETYSQTLSEAAQTKGNLEELEYTHIGWTHTRVGGWLTDHWGLPATVRETVKLHHQPNIAMRGEHGPLVSLVAIANNLSKVVGIGKSGNPHIESVGPLLEPLKLTPADIKAVGDEIKQSSQ